MRAPVLATVGLSLLLSCRPDAPPTAPPETAPAATADVIGQSDLPPVLEAPVTGDPLGATIHRLSNGMTVYISTIRDVPRIRALVAVRAGGRHDPAHATGLAHYLEHMVLFKGSDELGTTDHASETPHLEAIRALYRKLPEAKGAAARDAIFAEIDEHTQAVAATSVPNDVPSLYDRLGFSSTNAFTYPDHTHYVTELPRNRVAQWAEVESERLADPVFRLFYPELEAVYEEKNRGLDNATRRLLEQTRAAMFPKHPLGTQTVLGKSEHLKTPAFDEMAAFFDRWYVPNNMAIVLAGDVDASVLPTLEKAFGRLSPAPLPTPEPGDLAAPKGRVETTVVAPGTQTVRILWRTVPATHPDAPVLEVVDRLLDDAMVGALNVDLELSGKAPWANAYFDFFREAGTTTVEAAVRDDSSHEAVEALLLASVGKLAAGKTTEAQLTAAKLQIAVDQTRRWEDPQARAWRMLQAFTRHEAWPDVAKHAERIAAVTRQDIQRVAKTYFGADFVVGKIVRGGADLQKIDKPKVTPLTFADAAASPMAKRIEAAKVEPIAPVFLEIGKDATETKTSFGRVLAKRNEDNDLFDLVVVVRRGMRRAPLLCHALSVWERSGTKDKSARALQGALYELGAEVQTQCAEDVVVLYLKGVDEHFDASVALLSEWLSAAKIDPALQRDVVASTLTQRTTMLDHDWMITQALRNFVYFGKDSPQMLEPSSKSLQAASAATLTKLVGSLMEYEHTIAYYGPRSGEVVAKTVALGSGKRNPGKQHQRRYRSQGFGVGAVHVVHRQSAQSNVHVVFPGAPVGRDVLPLSEATRSYLGRSAFNEIRGARALAYAVSAGVDIGEKGDDAALWGFVQTQADKVTDAVPALVELVRSPNIDPALLSGSVTKVRERLRSQRVNRHVVPLSIAEWDLLGVTRDPNAIIWDGLDAVETEAVAELTASLAKGNAIITIVGDTSRMDLEALSSLGVVKKHEPRALFSF